MSSSKTIMSTSSSSFVEKPTGYLGTLNEQQQQCLDELRKLILESEEAAEFEKHLDGDKFLLRFLRATMKDKGKKRVFQVKPAYEKLVSHLKWRKEFDLSKPVTELTEPEKFELYQKVRPTYRWKDEKCQTLVVSERFGYLGTYLKKEHLTEAEWTECLAYHSEHTAEILRSFDEEPMGVHAIIEESGLGFGFTQRIGMIKMINGVMATHYPESVAKIHVVNAPWIFEKIFGLCKVFMDADTVSKVGVHSGVPVDLFREMYDTDKLPKELGGDADVEIPVPLDAQPYFKPTKLARQASK